VEGKKCGFTVQYILILVNALTMMHIELYLFDVPRFDSIIAYVLTKYIMAIVN